MDTLDRIGVISKILDELDGAFDHLTYAHDIARQNNMPNKAIEFLDIKRQVQDQRKELTQQYKNACASISQITTPDK